MDGLPVTSHAGVLAILSGVCAFFFYLEKRTAWKLFTYLPPLIFIYVVPVILANSGVLPAKSVVYDSIGSLVLPMMLVLLLLKVDVRAAVRIAGRGLGVMLFGTLGVVLGAPLGLLVVKRWLGPDAWKAFGTLAGSWIGGTGNMAAVGEMLQTPGTEFGLAVLGDTTIYVIWLPILLVSKSFARRFASFTQVDPEHLARLEQAAGSLQHDKQAAAFQDYIYLLALAFSVAWLADSVAAVLPEVEPYINTSTWRILLVTTTGIGLSFTPLKRIAASHEVAMALIYLFVARMGASAELSGVASQAVPFLIGALLWIFVHGAFCLLGAKLLRVDIHTAAIASAANIGGAASAPIVAAHHHESLVPVSILMALIGYAIGNYAAYVAAILCRFVQG